MPRTVVFQGETEWTSESGSARPSVITGIALQQGQQGAEKMLPAALSKMGAKTGVLTRKEGMRRKVTFLVLKKWAKGQHACMFMEMNQ